MLIEIFKQINLLLTLLVIKNVHTLCVGVETRVCLNELSEEEATEKLQFILGKYEEVDMKIMGKPIGVNGKRIVYGDSLVEEFDIGFRYVDNTEYDILQYCVFVLVSIPGQCDAISTVCNTFLPRTPRPLLEREPLTICADGVVKENETTETTVETKVTTNVER